MITIDFSQKKNLGLCEYLYTSIRQQIIQGILKPDSKLPSKRALSSHLGVSIITVQNAYAQLIAEGYIYSIEKKGFYVTPIISSGHSASSKLPENFNLPSSPDPESSLLVDFTANQTNFEKFPFSIWSRTMRQVLNSPNEKLLRRSNFKGVFELRNSIASYLMAFRNMKVSPEQIVIGSGTENLYSLLVQFFGKEKIFALENPGYKKAREIFELNGATCIPIPLDEQGFSSQELIKSKADIIHISPNHHFPTGIIMPIKRRMELLDWCKSMPGRFILEDDYDSEFRFNGKPLPTMQNISEENNVIYLNTFTKTLSPSLRIGYMVLPLKLVKAFEEKFASYSCQVSVFEQFTLAAFIDKGFYETHINRMKNYYRGLRNSLIQEFQKSSLSAFCKITEEYSGLHFLLTVNSSLNGKELQKILLKNGIKISLLDDYYYDLPENNQTEQNKISQFVVNYSGIQKKLIPQIIARMETSLT